MERDLLQSPSAVKKVVFVGSECTGKTSLARLLAQSYNTQWVREYMREYLQEKWDREKKLCQWEDLMPIAKGQIREENQKAKQAKDFLFCDVNLFELMVYSYVYYGKCDPQIEKYALENKYDFVFLTDIDVPWVADDLRDKPFEREQMHKIFEDSLIKNNIHYHRLSGTLKERMEKVKKIIEK